MLGALQTALAMTGIDGLPRTLLADAGYFSAANIAAARAAGTDPLSATGRLKHGQQPAPAPRGRDPAGLTPKQLMARELRTRSAAHHRHPRPPRPPSAQTVTDARS
jgi:hypothetical protein